MKAFLKPYKIPLLSSVFDALNTSPLLSRHGIYSVLQQTDGRWGRHGVSTGSRSKGRNAAFPEWVVLPALWANLPTLLCLAAKHLEDKKRGKSNVKQ